LRNCPHPRSFPKTAGSRRTRHTSIMHLKCILRGLLSNLMDKIPLRQANIPIFILLTAPHGTPAFTITVASDLRLRLLSFSQMPGVDSSWIGIIRQFAWMILACPPTPHAKSCSLFGLNKNRLFMLTSQEVMIPVGRPVSIRAAYDSGHAFVRGDNLAPLAASGSGMATSHPLAADSESSCDDGAFSASFSDSNALK
jgi:hypothetical protein